MTEDMDGWAKDRQGRKEKRRRVDGGGSGLVVSSKLASPALSIPLNEQGGWNRQGREKGRKR